MRIFLSIGSNLGKREDNLKTAIELIGKQCGNILGISSVYETAAWGKTDQPNFLNQAIEIDSYLTVFDLLEAVLAIEKQLGRTRIEKWGARLIDIDILYFDSTILKAHNLVIPHPDIALRRFVLAPLCDIAPEFLHPLLLKSNYTLLQECADELEVTKID